MNKEVIILAGGLGTRLRSVVAEQPKCLAPINGKPFLEYLIRYVVAQKIYTLVLSLGYKNDLVIRFIQEVIQPRFPFLQIDWVIEESPQGTGGGITLALAKTKAKNVFIINGDTFFDISLNDFLQEHERSKATCSVAVKQMQNFDRYGAVVKNAQHQILQFKEKQYYQQGLINGGVYLLDRADFLQQQIPLPFSFEKKYLEQNIETRSIYGFEYDNYFIDIGIPEDYAQVQKDFKLLFHDDKND